jgi:cell division GTPase FtsZ
MVAAIPADKEAIMADYLIITLITIIPAEISDIIGMTAITEIMAGIIASGDSSINLITGATFKETIDIIIRVAVVVIGINHQGSFGFLC